MFQTEIILSLFSDHIAINLEISDQKIKILGKVKNQASKNPFREIRKRTT